MTDYNPDLRFEPKPGDSEMMVRFKQRMEFAATVDAVRDMYACEHPDAAREVISWLATEGLIDVQAVEVVEEELANAPTPIETAQAPTSRERRIRAGLLAGVLSAFSFGLQRTNKY